MHILLLNTLPHEPSVICFNYKVIDDFMDAFSKQIVIPSNTVSYSLHTHEWSNIPKTIKSSVCSNDDDYCLVSNALSLNYEPLSEVFDVVVSKDKTYFHVSITRNTELIFESEMINFYSTMDDTNHMYSL